MKIKVVIVFISIVILISLFAFLNKNSIEDIEKSTVKSPTNKVDAASNELKQEHEEIAPADATNKVSSFFTKADIDKLKSETKHLSQLISDDIDVQSNAFDQITPYDKIDAAIEQYGNDILPYLAYVIAEQDNKNSKRAIRFLFDVSEYIAIKLRRGINNTLDEKEYNQVLGLLPKNIPELDSYLPLKTLLLDRLSSGVRDSNTAFILAKGYEPDIEIEEALARQFAQDNDEGYQSSLLGALWSMAAYSDVYEDRFLSADTMPIIIAALDHRRSGIVQTASLFISKYKPRNALPKLKGLIYTADDNVIFSSALFALSAYGESVSDYAPKLEDLMDKTTDASRKQQLKFVIDRIRSDSE